ncbi:43695_t:CDS:2 [Gigaspora margarita]|uniref:43695_t:CDS:1 n=1 Tax=Gigaspora margarita TaxID=4874 RepID=A0ABN7VC36_GIGMA|nr:43695_t:CDS:2 [Gigaspora margarita]
MHPEAYTSLLKATCQSQEHNTLKYIEKQAQASSTTINKDTTKDILKNTDNTTDCMSKS